MEEQTEKLNLKLDQHITEIFEAIRLLSYQKGQPAMSEDRKSDQPSPGSYESGKGRSGGPGHYSGRTRLAKLDFPRFNGDNLKEWLGKVEQFFSIDVTPEDMKVGLASMHFDGLASAWHQSVMQSDEGPDLLYDWTTYRILLVERFEDVLDDLIAELKELKETDGIVDYHGKFELIRVRVKMTEAYLVSAYLASLRTDTQMHVRMFQPQTVRQCLMLGRLYEKAHPKKHFQSTWSQSKPANNSKGLLLYKKEGSNVVGEKNEKMPWKPLSQEEMSKRRAEGLCYFCDEKYTPGHYLKHKKTQLFMIEAAEEEEEELIEQEKTEENDGDCAHISVNAVAGITGYRTMRVKGVSGKRAVFVLVDSGSTHNFIDPKVAMKLNCTILPTGLARVAVADGSKLAVSGRVSNLQWNFQHNSFIADFMVIPLGGCDMVLGVQWLEQWGPITWDFQQLTMKFKREDKYVLLHGLKDGSVHALKAQKINQYREEEVQIAMICVHEVEEPTSAELCSVEMVKEAVEICPAVSELLTEFADIFEEPKSLPPFREHHNHKIPLIEGSNPVNQRPYRYALYQKNEIDNMVKELLQAGTIQHSSSPYASPVVLVKKKNGTWRLCVDYRGLNVMTVKDRFPIPLIEDLMDELGGSAVYSKIDLRAGYHQVRMDPADIHKTAFKTHSGHFEYLVMPFGLTNAPATFQGLMNAVFEELLRKGVLIFFDDILVYSPTIEVHLVHLRRVFELMRENKLYAKMSKCSFATDRVEYLGHYIQASGVSTDPQKVKAVKEWPVPSGLKQLRGFLGLAGYYRRFVRDFGSIARPLTI